MCGLLHVWRDGPTHNTADKCISHFKVKDYEAYNQSGLKSKSNKWKKKSEVVLVQPARLMQGHLAFSILPFVKSSSLNLVI